MIPEPNFIWCELPGLQRFRSLKKPTQWGCGLLIIGTAFALVANQFRSRQPDEPQQAIFWTLVLLVVTVVLSELLRPKPKLEDARPLGLGDFQFPTATEGRVIPLIFGRVIVRGPNVIWYGDLKQEAITEKVKTGLWSSERVTRGFRYFLGVQFAICRGPAVLRRVIIDDNAVFTGTQSVEGFFDIDVADLFGGDEFGSGGLQSTVDFFPGTNTQSVSAYLNTVDRQRVATAITPTAPRYSGTCHLVVRQLTGAAATANDTGAYLGNSTNITPWEFDVQRFPALFSGQTGIENTIGANDANPMNVIYELLTNTEWGFGFNPADIDVGPGSSFLDASDTLISEVNGFSMVVDRALTAKDFLGEVQRQIDGVVFLDQFTGLWKIKLIRFDYNINTVPQFTDSNVKSIRDFTRGSWEDTTNVIQVKFDKRSDEYKESYALAQDMANAIIVAGGSTLNPSGTVGNVNYPGVKNAALASNLAWRDLRGQTYPLARCTFVVTREFWDLKIGDVVAWTTSRFGFVKLPMRVTRIDYGKLESNEITVNTVQDVFQFAAASMGTPPPTGWTPPTIGLVAFPATQQLAFEAPRAILTRDPAFAGDPDVSKVFVAARRQGGEVAYDVGQRNSSGTPSGAFADAGQIVGFMRIGQLDSALAGGTAIPTATITINSTPDSQLSLEEVFDDTSTLEDLGVNLVQLILINNEFMLVKSAANGAGSDVDLQTVYRGVLDSVQGEHAANDNVYLVFVGAGLTSTIFSNTFNVDIELRMRSATDVFSGSTTVIGLTMAKRPKRPYPPGTVRYNGTGTNYGTPDLEGDGSGLNGFGFNVAWFRRNFETADEVTALLSDDTGVLATTEFRVRLFVDPDGANVETFTGSWATGVGPILVPRLGIINAAAAGTEVRVQIEARHDYAGETDIVSRYNLFHDKVPTTVLTGLFYFGGGLGPSTSSASYTAAATGTFTIRIGAAYSTSNVEVNVNGAGFVVEIAAGLTSGTFSATSGNSIVIRHTVSETPSPNFVELDNPSAVKVAYGTFVL